ncbi:MAG: hypothetical protein WDO16_10895 [Bacteroidota bacterium]
MRTKVKSNNKKAAVKPAEKITLKKEKQAPLQNFLLLDAVLQQVKNSGY